jgi:CRISPR/Cas system-associated exonuclease Cas4 (RecB family)
MLGKLIEENTYKRRSDKYCNFDIGDAVVDYIDFKNKIIYETKKSSCGLDFYQYQLKYYLYLLNDGFTGVIEVPKERKKIAIGLNEDDVIKIKEAVDYIEKLFTSKEIIKERKNKNFCKKCSFFNYCYI